MRTINDDAATHAIYPVALMLDDNGTRVTAPEVFRWAIKSSTKPEIPLNYFFCQLGLFSGASVNSEYIGRLAGVQVSSILGGSSAGDLPIVEASDYAIVFNMERAKALNRTIPEDVLLAADSVFKKMTLLQVKCRSIQIKRKALTTDYKGLIRQMAEPTRLELAVFGVTSFPGIARKLNAQKVRTARGGW